jgi:twitching motility protein PilT
MNLIELLKLSMQQGASDLHLSSGLPPFIRVQGELVRLPETDMWSARTIESAIYELITEEQRHKLIKQLELDFTLHYADGIHCRVNVFYQRHGLSAVFRIISQSIPSFDDLGLPRVLQEWLLFSQGLILITGPTGSGKSSTLAAMVDYINEHAALHILTLEDPIEFLHQSKKSLINQRQIYRDTPDFSSALRSAMREDPDVILIGELRDLDTIRLALTAAETGHLVLATLHTSSAARTVSRIIDVFPQGEKNRVRNMLSESLQGVVCQALLPRVSQGRVAAFEIMQATPAIRNLIREDKITQMYSVMQTGGDMGMCTFAQAVQMLVEKQIITIETANLLAKAPVKNINSYC